MTICHDCTQFRITRQDGSETEILLGASLDEQCILNQLKKEKIACFKSRSAKSMCIQIGAEDDSDLEYEILCTNEFSSERKMMSVVVKEKATERYFCFAKGAESQIFASLSSESAESTLKKKVEAETFNFGSKGLRTLVFAMREMTKEEIDSIDWNSSNTKALSEACE